MLPSPPPPKHQAAPAPFRVEVVTVTGLTIASTFPLELALVTAVGYAEDRDGIPMRSTTDRIALRTVVLRFYGEILDEKKPHRGARRRRASRGCCRRSGSSRFA